MSKKKSAAKTVTEAPELTPGYISKGEYRDGGRAVRPKDAATLLIVRRGAGEPRVLMGQRSAQHKFMPNKFVFPGGKVDVGDGRIRA